MHRRYPADGNVWLAGGDTTLDINLGAMARMRFSMVFQCGGVCVLDFFRPLVIMQIQCATQCLTMLRKSLLSALARLASLTYQRRYILEGDFNEYALPEEILEDVDNLIVRARRRENSSEFTAIQWAALDDVYSCLDRRSDHALSCLDGGKVPYGIVLGVAWTELRAVAAGALLCFGFHIDKLRAEDVDDFNWDC